MAIRCSISSPASVRRQSCVSRLWRSSPILSMAGLPVRCCGIDRVFPCGAKIATTPPWRPATSFQLICKPFYESDCQGQTPASLIAGRLFSRQSAPTPEGTRLCGASGFAGPSASASFTSIRLPIQRGRIASARVRSRDANHGSIRDSARSRPDASSGSARGPRVRRVPRLDCSPGERIARDCPPHRRPGSWSRGERTSPPPPPRGTGR